MAQCISGLVRRGLCVPGARLLRSFPVAECTQALVSRHPNRCFSGTQHRLQKVPGDGGTTDRITLHFINRDGEKFSVTAKEGESLLDVVVHQNLDIDGFGACEGTLACSTCHLIFEEDAFQKLGAIPDEELDMLDLAYGLTDTSRLGCQVQVKKWMDGLTVQVPVEVSDIRRELEVEKQGKQ
ncbi:adrenodoxin-like [Hemicordylus capensis]|uniref:adrenodoxin-like n=1 Tax=Hemicordylus capensis TaxID=884348 RepID=UPI0023043E4E|nr:adrenodoxin-like [Hemicordylus capensis]